MTRISDDALIGDLLRECPETGKELERHGLLCLGCKGSRSETLRRAAQNHGVLLEPLIADLKAALKAGR